MHQIPQIGPVTGTGAFQLRQILAPIPRLTKRRPPDAKGDGGTDDPAGGHSEAWNRPKTAKRAAAQATEAVDEEGETGGPDEKQGLVTDASESYKLEIWDWIRP